MGKTVSYFCDVCRKPDSETSPDLEQVTIYIHQKFLDEPKVLDLEDVCQQCRDELTAIIKSWANIT